MAFCRFDGVILGLRARGFCTFVAAAAGEALLGGGHGQSEAVSHQIRLSTTNMRTLNAYS